MLLVEYRYVLLEGFLQTLALSLVVVIAATVVAVVMAYGLTRPSPLANRPVFLIVEVLRDIPLMVAVFLTYFVLPRIGIALDPFWSTTVSISLWGGANGAQIIRAGLQSVPTAQRETAAAFGLRSWKGLVFVILPQAMPVILPPYVGLVTALVQATSLGAVVGVHELLRSAQVLIEQTTISRGGSPAFLVYGFILIVYFLLCWIVSRGGQALERRFDRAGAARAGAATDTVPERRPVDVIGL